MSYKEFRDKVLKENSNEYWFEKGKIDAEQRIIKLMEEEVRYDFPPIIEMSLDSFIALIKGEQK